MTAITTGRTPAGRSDPQLLRVAMRADATLCAGAAGFACLQYLGARRLA